jgi:hypothetical protein
MSGHSRYANHNGSDFSEIVGAEDLESPTREHPQKGNGLRAVVSLQALPVDAGDGLYFGVQSTADGAAWVSFDHESNLVKTPFSGHGGTYQTDVTPLCLTASQM